MRTALLLLVTSLLISGAEAMAVEDIMCRYYGETAIEATALSTSLRCGFTGSRWSTNPEDHFRWCTGKGIESVIKEVAGRMRQLDSCSHSAMCEEYARSAMRASRMNDDLRCGLRGSRYEQSAEGHRDWCLGTSEEAVIGEMRKRYHELDRCSRSYR